MESEDAYLLQHLGAEPRQHLDAVAGEVVHHLGPLAVTDQAEDAAQTRHAHLAVGRDQHVAGLHAAAAATTHTHTQVQNSFMAYT